MSESVDTYRRIREARRLEGEANRRKAAEEFPTQAERLKAAGIKLRRYDESHYSAHLPGRWILNIYPGPQRLYGDPRHGKPPFLDVPSPWTLTDVVDQLLIQLDDYEPRVF